MTHEDLQGWLDRYVEAWRANERAPIEALFTDDAVYRYNPYGGERTTVHGSAAIADGWLGEDRDEPGTWEASYEPFAVDGERAVAVGYSRYFANAKEPERTYSNCYLLRFAPDGRCSEFTEYFMLQKAPES